MAWPNDPMIPPPMGDDLVGAPVGFDIPPPVVAPVEVAPAPVEALPAGVVVPPPVPVEGAVPQDMGAPIPPPVAPGSPAVYDIPAQAPATEAETLITAPPLAPVQPPPEVAGAPPEPPAEEPERVFRDPETEYQVRVAEAAAEQARANEAAMIEAEARIQAVRDERQAEATRRAEARQDAFDAMQADMQRYQDKAGKERILDKDTRLALAVSVVLKGLARGFSGGRIGNDAAQLIDRTLRQRGQDLARQDQAAREKIAARRQQFMDLGTAEEEFNRQTEIAVAAEEQQLAHEIRQQAAAYSSAKEQAHAETLAARLEAQSSARLQANAEKREIEILEQRRENRKLDLQFQKIEQQERESKRQAALGWANINQRRREADAQLEMRAKELEAKGQKEQAELVRKNGVPLPGAGGQMMIAPDPESARDMRKRITAGKQIVDIADSIVRKRNELGKEGFGSWIRTSEGKKMTAEWRNLFMENKDFFQLGAIQGADEKLIEGLIGEDPATTWTTTAPILEATRGRIVQRTNSMLIDNDTSGTLQGFRWDPPKPAPPVATETSNLVQEFSSRARPDPIEVMQASPAAAFAPHLASESQRRSLERAEQLQQPGFEAIERRTNEAIQAGPNRRKEIVGAMRAARKAETNPARRAQLDAAIKRIEAETK